ncbi:MAG: hypothetical protein EB127_07345, partial [Alphaproteobacteria bacterium]|nr:hypothetical protein [Alphaproteobacteria bacterium]
MKKKKKKKKSKVVKSEELNTTLDSIEEQPAKKKNAHYIDNKKFYSEMVKWKDTVNEARETGEPLPPVSEYIGRCFLEIAENLSKKPNFMNYAFK